MKLIVYFIDKQRPEGGPFYPSNKGATSDRNDALRWNKVDADTFLSGWSYDQTADTPWFMYAERA